MQTRSIFYVIIILPLLMACQQDWMGEQTKPKGRGEPGEIVLVLDSARWAGEVGSAFRNTFRASVEGLPRDEPMFDLRHVNPFQFKGILKQARNLILVVPLNEKSNESQRMRNFFTQNALDSIRKNEDIFLITREDLFATNQQVVFIIGHSERQFLEDLSNNKERLRNFFNRVEEKRTYKRIYDVRRERLIMNNLRENYPFLIQVPFGWKIAMEEEDFIWLRQAGDEIDKNIFISYKPYTDEDQFDDEKLIEWRNEITKKYVYGDPEKANSYVITEPTLPPDVKEVNFNGQYAKKLTGRWKTKNITMGGPFISYVVVDENLDRMYYIDGFLFSPGVEQRELVRELDVILKTFEMTSEE